MPDKNLIYDVGAHDGSDTAYYLKQGYGVVAIEANPILAGRLNTRFADEKAAGRLIVLNVAVTEEDREGVSFYVSKDDWKSSLIREMAQTVGGGIDPVEVPGRGLCSLFDEFGIPWYCKIDIEGYDARAIAGLAKYAGRPPHISCETSSRSIGEVHLDNNLLYPALDAMASAGYSKFKLVDQESLVVLSAENHYAFLHKWSTLIRTKLERWSGLVTPRCNNRLYQLKNGSLAADSSSGAFGEALSGEWIDYDTTKRWLTYHFKDYFNHTKNKQLIFWVDIHAKY
jgi:FkbM family methyltransferase